MWTPDLRSKLGVTQQDDGFFWMPYHDFLPLALPSPPRFHRTHPPSLDQLIYFLSLVGYPHLRFWC